MTGPLRDATAVPTSTGATDAPSVRGRAPASHSRTPAGGWAGGVRQAQDPDLLGLLQADGAGQRAGAVASVERAAPGPRLPEAGIVGGDGEVADEVEHVAAADGLPGDHGDDRLGQPADLHLQ